MRSSVSSVPATSANLAAALTIAACALYALKYLRGGILGFIAACYAVWLLARAYNIWFGLRKNQKPLFLSGRERGIYKHFALYLYRPQLAFFFSTTLHWLRLAVFAWILVALWQGLYVEAIVLALPCWCLGQSRRCIPICISKTLPIRESGYVPVVSSWDLPDRQPA